MTGGGPVSIIVKLLETLNNVGAVKSLQSALMVFMGVGLLIASQEQGQVVESVLFWFGLVLLASGVLKMLILAFSKSSFNR